MGWQIGETTYKVGDTVTVTGDTLLTAVWRSTEPAEAETPAAVEPEHTEAEAASVEEQPAEVISEAASVEEEPVEAEVPVEAEEPIEAEKPVEAEPESKAVTEAEEPVVAEEPVEAEPEAAPVAEEPVEAEPKAEAPKLGPECTICFESGGADGEMKAVGTNEGAEYTLPECAYQLEGCFFECWEISGAGIEQPFVVNAGDTIVVTGDMTATALWNIDESYVPEAEIVEGVEAEPEVEEAAEGDVGDGLVIEYDEVPEEIPDVYVDEDAALPAAETPAEETAVEIPAEESMPSEVGSVFNGAGTAAIVAAIVLVLAAAGIAVTRKKKK